MAFNLSIVNIIADKYKDTINAIAAYYGTGDNALSVKLVDKDNNVFWGCHSWWQPEHYLYFKNALPPSDINLATEALAALYERIVDTTVSNEQPYQNWSSALEEKGLTIWVDPNDIPQ